MTEEEAEEILTPSFTPELLPEKRFQVMIKDAQLDESRANYLLQNFSGYFKEAAEWAKKAKTIIVTNESQTALMEQAKEGRVILSKKRNEIEKARKWMKEPALREGQAIDKIANLLKDTIIPTEEHLKRQECFIELKQKAEEARLLAEVQAKMEAERIAKEEADRKALALAQAENERLRREQEKIKKENEAKIEAERIKRQAELELVRKENESKLAKERDEREKAEKELRDKKTAEMKVEADRIHAEEALLSADDQTKMVAFRKEVEAIKAPEVKSAVNKRIIADAESHLHLAISKIKPEVNVVQEEE